MNVLVVNCGSSSLKYQLLDMTNETELAKGLFEKIGNQDAIFTHKRPNADKLERVEPILNHKEALRILLDILVKGAFPWLNDLGIPFVPFVLLIVTVFIFIFISIYVYLFYRQLLDYKDDFYPLVTFKRKKSKKIKEVKKTNEPA